MNIGDAIVLFGVIQGFTTGAIILRLKRGNRSSNYLIASLLFVLGLTCFNLLIGNLNWYIRYNWVGQFIRFFPLLHAILIGPIIYLMVKSEADSQFLFKSVRGHLLVGIWSFIPHFVEIYRSIFQPSADYRLFMEVFFRYGDIVLWSTATVYLLLSRRLLLKTEAKGRIKLLQNFINLFLLFQFVIWLPFLVVYVSPWDHIIWENGIDYYFIYIPMVVLIYWVGTRWVMDSSGFKQAREKREVLLDAQELESKVIKLKEVVESEKLYLDVDLSLKSLAGRIPMPINHLSYVLNEGLSKNFNEFINEYRVEEVCKKLNDDAFDHLTIAALALSSGFKSVPTFQRTFKQVKGKTPKEFKKGQEINS